MTMSMESIVRRNTVRYAIQRQMFCSVSLAGQSCGRILDLKSAILIDSMIICGSCWKRLPAESQVDLIESHEVWTGKGEELS